MLFDECWIARGQISAALLQRGDGLRHGRWRGAASLSDAEPLADDAGLIRSRQAIEMEGTFIVAVLGDAAKLEPLLHIGPASRRFPGSDVEQEALAIDVDAAKLAKDGPVAAAIGEASSAPNSISSRERTCP